MENMIREYLKKLQDLQLRALDKGINMEINTRHTEKTWLVSRMNLEGCDFPNEPDVMHPNLYFSVYEFETADENRARLDEQLKIYEQFIEKYGK